MHASVGQRPVGINQGLQIGDAVNVVAFNGVGFDNKEARFNSGRQSYVGVAPFPICKVTPDLIGVACLAPALAVAVLSGLV